ncbi:SDR family oxidoreductase [Pseudomonadota bacterium]
MGERVAQLWQQQHSHIYTAGRSDQTVVDTSRLHIRADLDKPASLRPLSKLINRDAIVYYFAPPPNEGAADPRMESFLSALEAPPKKIIYISTSGVYGDCHGEWITEERPTKPDTPRSQRRLAAEIALQQWCTSNRVASVILRVGGIYAPNKLPLERLKAGMNVLQRDHAPFSNRIHADDLANICFAANHCPHDHAIYNVSDGHPSTMSDYFITVANSAGLAPPNEIDWKTAQETLSPAMLSYLNESKRLDSSKVLKELEVSLKYPTLNDGLRACGLNA